MNEVTHSKNKCSIWFLCEVDVGNPCEFFTNNGHNQCAHNLCLSNCFNIKAQNKAMVEGLKENGMDVKF